VVSSRDGGVRWTSYFQTAGFNGTSFMPGISTRIFCSWMSDSAGTSTRTSPTMVARQARHAPLAISLFEKNLRQSSVSNDTVPSLMKTRHLPHFPCPPQTTFIGRPAARAASRMVVPEGTTAFR